MRRIAVFLLCALLGVIPCLGAELSVPGLDEAWVLETGGGDCDLVLRRGDQVWEISCRNSDPAGRLNDYAAVLAAFQ